MLLFVFMQCVKIVKSIEGNIYDDKIKVIATYIGEASIQESLGSKGE